MLYTQPIQPNEAPISATPITPSATRYGLSRRQNGWSSSGVVSAWGSLEAAVVEGAAVPSGAASAPASESRPGAAVAASVTRVVRVMRDGVVGRGADSRDTDGGASRCTRGSKPG